MPRPKKTEAQRRAERFDLLYRIGKAKTGLKEPDIASMLGVSRDTLRLHRQDPGSHFTVRDLDLLATAFEWSDEEFLSVARPKRM